MKMNLPGVHGGVSQQSPLLRLQNQHENAANVVFDVIDGVKTRWPIRRVGWYDLTGFTFVGSVKTTDGILWMCYHKYVGGTYTLMMVPDDPAVSVVTLTGTTGYLAVASDKLKTYPILDTVLMLNTDKVVTVKTITETIANRAANSIGIVKTPKVYEGSTISFFFWVTAKRGSLGLPAGTILDGGYVSYTAAAGDTPVTFYNKIKTDISSYNNRGTLNVTNDSNSCYISIQASRVTYGGSTWKSLTSSQGVTPVEGTAWTNVGAADSMYQPWDAGRTYYADDVIKDAGSTIRFDVTREEFEVDFYGTTYIEGSDDLGNTVVAYATVANSFEDLPPRVSSEAMVFKLASGYYVYYNYDSQVYEETSIVGHRFHIDKTTVPHELRYTAATHAWALSSVDAYESNGRLVGDNTSAPLPLFVGQKLNGVFFYRNRLCFLSLNNVSMSRVGNFYQFFPDTATEVLDSDPISVYPAYKEYSPLLYGIPYNKQLLLIGPDKQYVLHSGYDALSPTTVAIDEATSYKLLPQMEPLLLENSLVLFLDQGEYAGVLEYRLSDQEIATEGAILTDNVPRYIPNDITNALYLQSEHMILCYKQDTDTIYVYKFHKNEGGQRMQSAWVKWTWPISGGWYAIAGVASRDESTLVLCTRYWMHTMSTDEAVLDVPAIDILGEGAVVDGGYCGIGFTYPYNSIVVEKTTGKRVELDGSYHILWDGTGTTEIDVWIGVPIEWSLELSPLILRDDNGLPRADLKSTIKNMQVDWSGGDFRVKTFGTNLPTRTTDVTPVTYQIHEIVPGESMRQVHPSRVLVMADSKRCRISLERGEGYNHVKIHNIAYNLEVRKDKG